MKAAPARYAATVNTKARGIKMARKIPARATRAMNAQNVLLRINFLENPTDHLATPDKTPIIDVTVFPDAKFTTGLAENINIISGYCQYLLTGLCSVLVKQSNYLSVFRKPPKLGTGEN